MPCVSLERKAYHVAKQCWQLSALACKLKTLEETVEMARLTGLPLRTIANQAHRFEMARALLMLGDTEGVPILIDGLESPNIYARMKCLAALRRGTNMQIPFKANASDEERAEGVEAWRKWWSEMEQDQLLVR